MFGIYANEKFLEIKNEEHLKRIKKQIEEKLISKIHHRVSIIQ